MTSGASTTRGSPTAAARIGFVFQSFNLVPTLTAGENITLPSDLAGKKVDKGWFDYLVAQLGIGDRFSPPADRDVGRPAAALRLRPGPDHPARARLRRRAHGQPGLERVGRDARVPERSVTEFGQSIVMVTHDPHGASYADRVVFLADGQVVGELANPTPTRCSSTCERWAADMWRVTVKGLVAHKFRVVLTAMAIVLGVTFIAGTFILTDTLHNTFNGLFRNVYKNIDFQVRGVAQFASGGSGPATRSPVDPPGSTQCPASRPPPAPSRATPSSSTMTARPSPPAARPPGGRLRPQPAGIRAEDRAGTARPRQRGRDGPRHGPEVRLRGRPRVRVLFPGPTQTFTITGVARFGTANNLPGTTLAAFATATAQTLLGRWASSTTSTWWARRVPTRRRERDIAAVLPRDVEVVTGRTVVDEETNAVDQGLGFFTTALLIFAFISLFVGGSTIVNTFSIIVGQRTRELALLRVVGARRRQVFRSVLGEAAIVGLVSSLLGIGLGVLAAVGLEELLWGFGVTLPSGSLVFEARTVIVWLVVGVGVTMVGAVGPAGAPCASHRWPRSPGNRSSRTSPCGVARPRRGRRRLGVALLAYGLSQPAIALVGLGAVVMFVGVAMLAPAVARPWRASWPAAGPHPRHLGEPWSGELHAQPEAHRPDRVGAHGRPRPGLDHRRVRRVAIAVGHRQCRQRHQHGHHRLEQQQPGPDRSAPPCRRGVRRPRGHRHLDGLRRPVRVRQSLESLLAVVTRTWRDGDPADEVGDLGGARRRPAARRRHHGEQRPPRGRRHGPGEASR